jgi:hypothetical protein
MQREKGSEVKVRLIVFYATAKKCKATFAEVPLHPSAILNWVPRSVLVINRNSRQNTHTGNLS